MRTFQLDFIFQTWKNQARVLKQLPMYITRQIRYFSSNPNVDGVSMYLRRAKLIDSMRLSLRSNSPDSLLPLLNNQNLDSFVVTNALRSAPSPTSALSLIETLRTVPHFKHTQNTLQALAKILAKSGQTARLEKLIEAINSGEFTNVARVSLMDRMRWFASAGDLDNVIRVWEEWRASRKQRPCTESYNIVMALFAQNGKDSDTVQIFRSMIGEGALPNSRTFTVIIEHLVKSEKLDSALEIFRFLPLMRVKRTSRQYSIMVGACIDDHQFDLVKTLLNEMRIDGMLPNRAMLWSLQKMKETGFDVEIEELVNEMLPDKRIKNINCSYQVSDDNDEDKDDEEDYDSVQLRQWMDPSALASALRDWKPEEVSELESAKFVWTTRLVCKMIRSFKSAETAWNFFCWVTLQPGFTHDVYTVSRMITKLAHNGQINLVHQLMSKIENEGIKLSFTTVRLIIDFYGISKHGQAALNVFRRVKTLCNPVSKNSMMLLYSSLLRALAKCQMNSEALEILEEMILYGIIPDIQTFSGLMHHFAQRGDIKIVQRLFGMVRQSRIEPDGYMFRVLIRAYCKCDRSALAYRVFEDMMNSDMMPDVSTKQLLVKNLWKEGKLREAAAVEERTEGINDVLPVALPGHLYTVSSSDLTRVYEIYSNSFLIKN